MNKDFVFTFIITGPYETFHRKPMIENFATYVYPNRVFVVNRPSDLINVVLRRKKIRKDYSYNNITVINSFLLLHDKLILMLPKLVKYLLYSTLRKSVKKYFLSNLNLIWIMHPDLLDYLENIPHSAIIYDSYDEFINTKSFNGIQDREKKLVSISNLIISSSKYSKEKKEKIYNTNKYINSSTAIDKSDFENQLNKFIDKEMKNFNGKIIGFAGSVRDDIDLETLKYLAEKKVNDSIVIVGDVHSEKVKSSLAGYENIYFLGKKNFRDFINYLKYFDVAIMPHILNDFILSSSPYKFYQYLASGLYIVSSPIPELIDFQKTDLGRKKLLIADTKEMFLESVNYFLSKKKENITDSELSLISWESRFDNIFKELYNKNLII